MEEETRAAEDEHTKADAVYSSVSADLQNTGDACKSALKSIQDKTMRGAALISTGSEEEVRRAVATAAKAVAAQGTEHQEASRALLSAAQRPALKAKGDMEAHV